MIKIKSKNYENLTKNQITNLQKNLNFFDIIKTKNKSNKIEK